MSNFYDDPSPWWHHLIVQPIYFCIFWFGDDYLLRKSGFSFWFVVCMLPFPIICYFAGVYTSGARALMLILKAYLVICPTILINWFRLANASKNINHNDPLHPSGSIQTSNDITDEMLEEREQQYLAVKKWVPKFFFNNFLEKYFTSIKSRQYVAVFFWFIFIANYLEPMYFEATSDNALNYKYDWSKYLNVYAGFICCVILPLPYKDNNLQFWYFDFKGKYTDFILYFEPSSKWYYFGGLYPILFSMWYLCFTARFIREKVQITIVYHVFLPLIRMCFRQNVPNTEIKQFEFGIWVQSRAQQFSIFISYVIFLRDVVFKTTMPYLWNPISCCDGYFLFVFAWVNAVVTTFYAIIWFGFYLPKRLEYAKEERLRNEKTQIELNEMENPQIR